MCVLYIVVGYDAMGYELAKPRLRAELENDLKLLVFCFSSLSLFYLYIHMRTMY